MTGDAAAAALPAGWFAHDEDGRMVEAPCRIDPRLWDTDRARIDDVRLAVRECLTLCPLIDACRVRRDDITATGRRSDGTVPELAGMVWAGRAYSTRGTPLDVEDPGTRTANRPDPGTRTANRPDPDTRTANRPDPDTRHVTADGRVYDGHTGTWVPAPDHLTRPARNRRTR